SVVSADFTAASPASLATVSIVPSTGFITALYSVLTRAWNALANCIASISFSFSIDLEKHLNYWDNITHEFPRAPINKPLEKTFPTSAICALFWVFTSPAPDDIDKFMFVPVSPSGTGNTFKESTKSALFDKLSDP